MNNLNLGSHPFNPRRSFALKLGAATAAMALFLALLISVLINFTMTAQLEANIGRSLSVLSAQISDKLDRGMFERYREIQLFAARDTLRDSTTPADSKRRTLESLQISYPDYAWIGLTDATGTVIVSTDGLLEGQDVSMRPWFQNATRLPFVGDVHEAVLLAQLLPNPDGDPLRFVDVAAPVVDSAGQLQGVLGAHLSWKWAEDVRASLIDSFQASQQVQMFILGLAGEVLLAPPGVTVQPNEFSALVAPAPGEPFHQIVTGEDGNDYLVGGNRSRGYRGYPGLGWTVLIRQPVALAFAPVTRLQRQVLGLGVMVGLGFAIVGGWLANRVAQPILAIAQAARDMSAGKAAVIPLKPGQDEIAQLSRSLHLLLKTLTHQERELRDATLDLERRVAERTLALESNKAQLQDFLDNASDLIQSVSPQGKFLFVNRLWHEVLGYTAGDLEHLTIWDVLHPDCHNLYEQALQQVMEGQVANWVEISFVTQDGRSVLTEGSINRRMERGEAIATRGIFRNITARKQTEIALQRSNQQLIQTNAELARATRLKDEFLATMSHELRTPLNAILGMSEALQEEVFGPINEPQQRTIATIERSGQHLLDLINDILDLSKIEAGKLDLHIAPVSVKYLCESSLTFVRQLAARKSIQLVADIPPHLPDLSVDERRIRQVLINLMTNAVKFTPEAGQITLEVRSSFQPTEDGSGSRSITFSVIDTGIGIAPEDIGKLFQNFAQIDSRLSRQHTGTGLGLALVRRLVEQHGGTVTLTSTVGQGSCFTVTLPYSQSTPIASAPPLPDSTLPLLLADNSRILVIEDSVPAAEQVSRYLQEMGLQAVTYSRGDGAIAEVLRLQPALVILDVLLPDRSGWSVLTELKANPQTQDIPVLVMSVVDEQVRGRELGATAYLVKPINRERLKLALAGLHNSLETIQTAPPLPGQGMALPKPQDHRGQSNAPLILLAEDHEANIVSVSEYLKSRGYELILARNGIEAVELAQCHRPDLILMDIQMPQLDGLQAIQQIRHCPPLAQTPIIALTALAMPTDRERCIQVGANEYLTKPVRLKQLAITIQHLLDV